MFDQKSHKTVLVNILKDIYKNSKLCNNLVFKGGTCLYLLYGLNRFSVDLDFNLVGGMDESFILNEVKKVASKYGKVKDAWIKRYTIFVAISYKTGSKILKIEISRRDQILKTQVMNFMGLSVLTMDIEDMFAYKLVAITNRWSPTSRDLYDANFLFDKMYKINEKIVKKEKGMSLKKYLGELLVFIKKFKKNKILDGVGELLGHAEKMKVKENLLKDLEFQIKLYINTYLE